jgi:hypothetical protein
MRIRLQVWLHVMDLFAWLDRSRLGIRFDFWPAYLWAVGKASDATDWGAETNWAQAERDS